MLAFDLIAERRIREAMERGEFDDLPCAGKPLDLSEDPLVPEDQRMAYRILRNAGFVPPEVEQRREIGDLERLVAQAADEPSRNRAMRRLQALLTALSENRREAAPLRPGSSYFEKTVSRLARGRG